MADASIQLDIAGFRFAKKYGGLNARIVMRLLVWLQNHVYWIISNLILYNKEGRYWHSTATISYNFKAQIWSCIILIVVLAIILRIRPHNFQVHSIIIVYMVLIIYFLYIPILEFYTIMLSGKHLNTIKHYTKHLNWNTSRR